MNKRQRAQVVELLRCAADIAITGNRSGALGTAVVELDCIFMPFLVPIVYGAHWSLLIRGDGPVQDRRRGQDAICGPGYEWLLLEAAMRVERGEWPE